MTARVQTGLDVLRQEGFSRLRGRRVGLVCHPASVAGDLCHVLDLFREASLDLRVLLGPEHGAGGAAQDMIAVPDGGQPGGVPFVSLYGSTPQSLRPSPEVLADIDVLVVDLQDIGCRYYTYAVTLRYCLEECARAGVQVVVTDRPNPINGMDLEGPLLQDGFRSFVGGYPVPVRHGLTIGELAVLAQSEGVDADLEIVPLRGWRRGMWFDQTGLPWVLPSPNMPTLDTATVYPGACLIEATNLSEGRGTTRPFELYGAPWLDAARLAASLEQASIAGVRFRPASFIPGFQKHAGRNCHGVQLHPTSRERFQPFLCGIALLQAARTLAPEQFRWRSEPYEFVSDTPAIDLLTGSAAARQALESGFELRELVREWPELFRQELAGYASRRRSFLLYPEEGR